LYFYLATLNLTDSEPPTRIPEDQGGGWWHSEGTTAPIDRSYESFYLGKGLEELARVLRRSVDEGAWLNGEFFAVGDERSGEEGDGSVVLCCCDADGEGEGRVRFESVRVERKVSSLWLVGLAMRTISWDEMRE